MPIVSEGLVLIVLVQAVAGIGKEASESNQHSGRQRLENGLGAFQVKTLAKAEADIEAGAHKAGEKGHEDALSEVEVLHGLLFLLLRECCALHRAGYSDDGNAHQGDHYADDDGAGQVCRMAGEHRTQNGAEGRAGAQGNALPQGHPQIPHTKAEGEASYAPQGTEQDGEPGA